MNIGQITKHYFPITGGQQTYIRNLVDIFARNKMASTIYQPFAPGAKHAPNVVVTSLIAILHRLDRYIPNIGWFVFNFELRFFKKQFEDHEVLISHYSFHYPPIQAHKRIIVLSHGVLWSEKLKTLFDRTLHRRDMALKDKENVFIVANDTDFIRRIGISVPPATGYFGEVAPRVWFIPNCVDQEFFSPDDTVPKEEIILVPRNIRPDRGIHLAISAFAQIADTYPNHRLKIVGGPLKGRYFNECRAMAKSLGIEGRVEFAGSCSWRAMRDEYRKAHVTIVPSIEKEGTSLSALESMACGTPVVGTDVAGLRDLPIVKASPTAADLALKLTEALAARERIAKIQRDAIISTFNLENWEKAWISVISKVTN